MTTTMTDDSDDNNDGDDDDEIGDVDMTHQQCNMNIRIILYFVRVHQASDIIADASVTVKRIIYRQTLKACGGRSAIGRQTVAPA